MQRLTILVNSCDKRSDAWVPFFELLHIFWKDCPYEIVLNTESKDFEYDKLNVRVIHTGNLSWGKRFKTVLNQIDSEYILYFLEDFFLMSDVSTDAFNEAFELMQNDKSIGFIGLKYNKELTFLDGSHHTNGRHFIPKDELKLWHRVNNQVGIWRKEWLLKLIREHETPWEFDNYASIRSKKDSYKVLLINNTADGIPSVFDYGVDVNLGYGIYAGKWLKNNKTLFERYGIEVDFEHYGWYDENEKEVRKYSKIKLMLYPLKNYFQKKYRRYKSMK